jgi:hypothetical protein
VLLGKKQSENNDQKDGSCNGDTGNNDQNNDQNHSSHCDVKEAEDILGVAARNRVGGAADIGGNAE